MNTTEARDILRSELERYRRKPYSELVRMVDADSINRETTASSGTEYQTEIQVFWNDKPNENVRVIGSVDDGGWRAYFPLCDGFIKSPRDEFVGE